MRTTDDHTVGPNDAADVLSVVVAGHVDHGKSTLIGRLAHELRHGHRTEADWAHTTDQLRREREHAMTLETTQLVVETADCRVVFIDVPGHRELVSNALSGITRADAAILVVAADEGVCEQTRRHVALLDWLRIGIVIGVVAKMDAAGYAHRHFAAVDAALHASFTGLTSQLLTVIPVSAATNVNLVSRSPLTPWYDGAPLVSWLGDLRAARTMAPAVGTRFVVQGRQTVADVEVSVGRLLAGRIAMGDCLIACPDGVPVAVRAIHRFPPDAGAIAAGECAALELAPAGVARGSVLVDGAPPACVDRFAARLCSLSRQPLRPGDRAVMRCATQQTGAQIDAIRQCLDTGTLTNAADLSVIRECDLARVTIRTDAPVTVEPFSRLPALGRFTLERDGTPLAVGAIERL